MKLSWAHKHAVPFFTPFPSAFFFISHVNKPSNPSFSRNTARKLWCAAGRMETPVEACTSSALLSLRDQAALAQTSALGLGVLVAGSVLLSWHSSSVENMEKQRVLRRQASGKVILLTTALRTCRRVMRSLFRTPLLSSLHHRAAHLLPRVMMRSLARSLVGNLFSHLSLIHVAVRGWRRGAGHGGGVPDVELHAADSRADRAVPEDPSRVHRQALRSAKSTRKLSHSLLGTRIRVPVHPCSVGQPIAICAGTDKRGRYDQ